MRRYQLAIKVTGLESESGERVDDKRIWSSFVHQFTVTREFLDDAIEGALGQQLEALLLKIIADVEGEHEKGGGE